MNEGGEWIGEENRLEDEKEKEKKEDR